METDLMDTGSDTAGKAFDKLRRELTTMRLAIEKLADEPTKIVIPDYTETLVEMTANVNAVAGRLKALRQAPALELTPESFAKQIADAGAVARSAEQATFASATSKLVAATRELLPYVESARTERIQNFWLAGAMGLGLTLGLTMGLILPGPIDRAMPESWHWPERAAANVLGRDMWDAGERLQAVADPKRLEFRATIETATADSKESIAKCLKNTRSTRKPVTCSVILTPEAHISAFQLD
jgi:Family of unknown function (DUF6118)